MVKKLGNTLINIDQGEADAHMVLPGGFIWRDGKIVNTDRWEVTFPELQFHHVNSEIDVAYRHCGSPNPKKGNLDGTIAESSNSQ